MSSGFGNLRAELATEDTGAVPHELIHQINETIRPPQPVTAEDVHLRAMFVVSDAVNSFGGRFPAEEHARLCELLVDSPVLVGHRKDQLPIARTFLARSVLRDGAPWVKSYFYWPKNAEGASGLAEKIDSGVIKECSIGFTFGFAECSICGVDVRQCQHQPLAEYGLWGNQSRCHFNYRQIERVLETSLVYRGATAGTSITDDLGLPVESLAALAIPPQQQLPDLHDLCPDQPLVILPRYAGVPVLASLGDEGWSLRRLPSGLLRAELSAGVVGKSSHLRGEFPGRIVAYRGKERCRLVDTIRFIETGRGPATRAVLYLLPLIADDFSESSIDSDFLSIRPMRYRFAKRCNVSVHARQLATKEGVEIWTRGMDGGVLGWNYCPSGGEQPRATQVGCGPVSETTKVQIRISHRACNTSFSAPGFDRDQLGKGTVFLLDPGYPTPVRSLQETVELKPVACSAEQGGWRFSLSDDRDNQYVIRPIRLNGRRRMLLYRLVQPAAIAPSAESVAFSQ